MTDDKTADELKEEGLKKSIIKADNAETLRLKKCKKKKNGSKVSKMIMKPITLHFVTHRGV